MKKDSFERGMLEYGAIMKQGYAAIIENSGKIIAVIAAIVASLVTFADITFVELTASSFTTTLLVLLLASYIIYFSLEDAGERLGEGTEEFKLSYERYINARARITPDMIGFLRRFCLDYSKDELNYRRQGYLCSKGFSAEEYEAYRRGAKASRRECKIFRHAERMTSVKLSPIDLLSRERVAKRSELENPEGRKFLYLFLKLLPSTLCMIFTASIILTAKPDLNVSVIIDGAIKLSTLPIIGFKGYESGFQYARRTKALWLETKARLLEDFLEKYKNNTKTKQEIA